MLSFKRRLRSRPGQLLVWCSLMSFILSLIIGPGPAEAITASVQEAAASYRGTHRTLSSAEMKSIQGAITAGSPDPVGVWR